MRLHPLNFFMATNANRNDIKAVFFRIPVVMMPFLRLIATYNTNLSGCLWQLSKPYSVAEIGMSLVFFWIFSGVVIQGFFMPIFSVFSLEIFLVIFAYFLFVFLMIPFIVFGFFFAVSLAIYLIKGFDKFFVLHSINRIVLQNFVFIFGVMFFVIYGNAILTPIVVLIFSAVAYAEHFNGLYFSALTTSLLHLDLAKKMPAISWVKHETTGRIHSITRSNCLTQLLICSNYTIG